MEREKLTQDEWDALLDDDKIPVKQDWAAQHLHAQAVDAAARVPKPEKEPEWDPSTRGYSIAMEALKIINGERQDKYGNPENTFKVIGDLWGAYLRALEPSMPPILPEDVANMMMLLKMARIACGKYCIDNDVDMLGYAMLGADMRRGDHD